MTSIAELKGAPAACLIRDDKEKEGPKKAMRNGGEFPEPRPASLQKRYKYLKQHIIIPGGQA